MKDYSINCVEKASFILNYKIVNNNIIINYANGYIELLPYSKENEDEILDTMKLQVVNSDEFTKETLSKFKSIIVPFGIVSYGSLGVMANNIINIVNTGGDITSIEGAIPVIALCLSIGAINTIKGIKYYLSLRDLDKNSLFQDNNFYMNLNMRIEDKYLEGVSEKTKEIIRNTKDGDNIFTFNTVDKMSYNDIKRILENIERYNPKEEDCTPRFKKRTRR